MIKVIKKLCKNSVVRYVFFGGLTTLVNLLLYYVLTRFFRMNITIANVISVTSSIIFAFVVNSKYVFESGAKGIYAHLIEFVKFIGGRILTMVIEVGVVWLMTTVWGINDMATKFIIQFVVIALNYIFSKFWVFNKQ